MKNNRKILYKKTILYIFIVALFWITPTAKIFAGDVIEVSHLGPKDNTITTSDKLDFNFNFKVPLLTTTNPDAKHSKDAIYFTAKADGEPIMVEGQNKYKIIFNENKIKTQDNTLVYKISWTIPSGFVPVAAKQVSWRLYDYYTNKEYVNESFTFKINKNYQGWYFITKSPTSVDYIYRVSNRFNDESLCKTGSIDYINNNPSSNIYQECKGYDYLPATPENEPMPAGIDPGKNTVTENKNVYNLLAPIPGLKCLDSSGLDTTCLKGGLGEYLNLIFKIGIGLCAALAVIMLIIYGVMYMGDESVFAKTEAKSKMFSAIIGLLIALGAYAILNTINPALTGSGGLSIDQVTVSITSGEQYRLVETQDTPGAKNFTKTSYYEKIKNESLSKKIPNCLLQVAIQRESGGYPSIGHDEDVPSANIKSRVDFIASGKKFDGTTFPPGIRSDPLIIQKDFKNNDHPGNYKKALNPNTSDLGLDWRFSHSVGMFGVTFGPNHLNPTGAQKIYNSQDEDISMAANIMNNFYIKCNNNIEGTWRAYGSGSCTGNNAFTNKETEIRMSLYNQCMSQL